MKLFLTFTDSLGNDGKRKLFKQWMSMIKKQRHFMVVIKSCLCVARDLKDFLVGFFFFLVFGFVLCLIVLFFF